MKMTDLTSRFVQFLPVWAKEQRMVLSAADKELGEDLLMALGALYLSLMLSDEPTSDLPMAILSQTTPMFAPLILGVLEDIALASLGNAPQGHQQILDKLHDAIEVKFASHEIQNA